MRTTSSLESMNATLRRMCPDHPHIFKFLDRLRLHEFSNSLNMLQAVESDAPMQKLQRRRQIKCKERIAKIAYLTEKLKEGRMTPGLFLETMANACTLRKIGKILLNMRSVRL